MRRFDIRVEGLEEARQGGAWLALSSYAALIGCAVLLLYAGGYAGGTSRMRGECQGMIAAHPASGYISEESIVDITIRPPLQRAITRVVTDNPGCRNCETRQIGLGRFRWYMAYQGQGPFTVEFLAYDREGKVRCSGTTTELRSLGPKP